MIDVRKMKIIKLTKEEISLLVALLSVDLSKEWEEDDVEIFQEILQKLE